MISTNIFENEEVRIGVGSNMGATGSGSASLLLGRSVFPRFTSRGNRTAFSGMDSVSQEEID
jgi:hypothetical protein